MKAEVIESSAPRGELDRLLALQHHDPHSILGAHLEGKRIVVRAFRPGAARIDLLVAGDAPRPMRMLRRNRTVRGRRRGPHLDFSLSARDPLPRRRIDHDSRSVLVHADARRARSSSVGRAEGRSRLRQARRARPRDGRRARRVVCGVGAKCARRQRGRRFQPLGRAGPHDAHARQLGRVGAVHSRRRRGIQLQVRNSHARRQPADEKRSLRAADGSAAGDGLGRLPIDLRIPRRRLACGAGAARMDQKPRLDLRGPSRLLAARARGGQSLAHLSRDGAGARRLRDRHGIHPRRAAARDGASVHRLVGLPGQRLFRADLALRQPRRLALPHRRTASPRHRRDPRLGAGAFSQGRIQPRPLRRHRAVRARRSAPGRSSRMGHLHFQLRPRRGAQLPDRQRALLAGRVPRRRPAG